MSLRLLLKKPVFLPHGPFWAKAPYPPDHPLNVGMLGMHGNYGPNVLTNECDVLIAIGMRFDDRVTGRLDKYAKQAQDCSFRYWPCRDW